MHHFGEIFLCAAKIENQVRLHLIKKLAPRARIKWRALHERRFHRLGQKMPLEHPHVLDPRPVLGNYRIAFVKERQALIAELDEFQLEEGEVLSADGAQFAAEKRHAWP